MDYPSSKASEEPCMHQQHDFKQEIEDSIRRCEELLSMAPMSYQPPDGKSSGRKGSRSTTVSARRSEGRSDVETVSSSIESDRKSAEVDPEWKKNMGLLINKQDGTVPHVSPRGASPRATPRARRRGKFNAYDTTDDSSHHESSPGKQGPVEEYNFSFDDTSRNSESHEEENLEQSISIRAHARAVLHVTTDESDDWAYERLGQASTPSTKTCHSEMNISKAESERRAFSEPAELLELEAFDDLERYPDEPVPLVEGQVLEQQGPEAQAQAEHEGDGCGCADAFIPAFMSRRSADENCLPITTPSCIGDEDCQVQNTTDRTASFARSVRSSRSSHPNRSPGRSSPKGPPGSPKACRSNRGESSAKTSHRINENSMSFSFTIPNQPKYAQDWEWLEECTGVDANQGKERTHLDNVSNSFIIPKNFKRTLVGSLPFIRITNNANTNFCCTCTTCFEAL